MSKWTYALPIVVAIISFFTDQAYIGWIILAILVIALITRRIEANKSSVKVASAPPAAKSKAPVITEPQAKPVSTKLIDRSEALELKRKNQEKFCVNCGVQRASYTDLFCISCGTKFDSTN